MKLYTLEWEARLAVQADTWKAGWVDFRVVASRPNAFESAVLGVNPKRLYRGDIVVLQGESRLQKAEQGWRALESHVKASRIEPTGIGRSFLGSWRVPSNNNIFKIEETDDGRLRFYASIAEQNGRIRWVNPIFLKPKDGTLEGRFAEGNCTIKRVSEDELLYIEEDAFGGTPSKATRIH